MPRIKEKERDDQIEKIRATHADNQVEEDLIGDHRRKGELVVFQFFLNTLDGDKDGREHQVTARNKVSLLKISEEKGLTYAIITAQKYTCDR